MATSCIYKITSPSGKVYIGQTIDYERRMSTYLRSHKSVKGQKKLYNSFIKYGVDKHLFNIIEEIPKEELNKREIFWILKYNSIRKGLNITIGGNNSYGYKMKESTKKKLSESAKKRGSCLTGEGKKRLIEALKNRVFSESHRLKLSSAHSNNKKYKERYESMSIPIVQLGKDFNTIAEFKSMTEASIKTGIAEANICRCVNKKRISAGGFYWRKKEEQDFVVIKKKDKKYYKKRVASYNEKMILLEEFESISSASRRYNCSASDIIQACKDQKRKVRKMYFRYL